MIDTFDWSGPEEGDGDDTVLVMRDGEEWIEIRDGTLAQRKAAAKRIAELLNKFNALIYE
jgi:hypothetical protein